MTDTEFVTLDRVSRRFGSGAGVKDLSLTLRRGEIVALLGPSGSGKTTTLRLLAGFEMPDSGRIVVDGEDITRVPPVRRRIGMVFQHYALFPHLSVGGNVAFGLEEQRRSAADVAKRVGEALAAVDLTGFEDRPIAQLSGGQQQRVAVARALAPEPRILLLDEPLSNLDPALRERTRGELRRLIQRIGITTVLVTHEQEEAFDLADRIAVLNAGVLDQLDAPEVLYREPSTPFVAGFVGRATLLKGTATATKAGVSVSFVAGLAPLEVPGDGPRGPLIAALRPEAFAVVPAERASWRGRVLSHRFLGRISLFRIQVDHGPEIEVEGHSGSAVDGAIVGVAPTGLGVHLFPDGR